MSAHPLRRLLLELMVLGLGALVARRAHALRDPSELSGGVSGGEHDVHLACGPDARVRNASAGAHYERVVQHPDFSHGVGVIVDVRGGVGTNTITSVTPVAADGSDQTYAQNLDAHERGRAHFLAAGQLTAGWDARIFAVRVGAGYYGVGDVTDDRYFTAKYAVLPAAEIRIGARTGLSSDLGIGAPPIWGLEQHYTAYGLVKYRTEEGIEGGAGALLYLGTLEERAGLIVKGAYPLTQNVLIGAHGSWDTQTKYSSHFNYTAGLGATFVLDR
jgi:hypothetical protein